MKVSLHHPKKFISDGNIIFCLCKITKHSILLMKSDIGKCTVHSNISHSVDTRVQTLFGRDIQNVSINFVKNKLIRSCARTFVSRHTLFYLEEWSIGWSICKITTLCSMQITNHNNCNSWNIFLNKNEINLQTYNRVY